MLKYIDATGRNEDEAIASALEQLKLDRDSVSVEILDMIVNARVFDMGYVYDGWKGASFLIQNMVRDSGSNFASTWASKEQSVTAHYAEVIEYFETYGE